MAEDSVAPVVTIQPTSQRKQIETFVKDLDPHAVLG